MINVQTPAYLYAIKLTLATPTNLINTSATDEDDFSPPDSPQPKPLPTPNTTTFGLIAIRPLLECVDFPIYTANGEEIVHIELVKSNIYFTPNQLKLVKSFHKFIFSNVLRMEGRGAAASPFLSNPASSSTNTSKSNISNTGCLICVLTNDTNLDVDWDMMKSVEGSTDRSFMRPPVHAKR